MGVFGSPFFMNESKYQKYDLPYDSFIGGWMMDEKICDGVVELVDEVKDLNMEPGVISGNRIDNSIKESFDLCIPASLSFNNEKWSKYLHSLMDIINLYLDDYDESMPNSKIGFREGHNIQFYPKNGGYKIWHCERCDMDPVRLCRHLVYMTFLNDIEQDGETEFKYQKIKIKPKKGLTLIWPSDWTHTHRGIPAPTEEKKIVTGWLHYLQ